jgi:uncharacterized protein
VMAALKMIDAAPAASGGVTLSSSSSWVRAPEGGILRSVRKPGDRVARLESLGVISDPLGEGRVSVMAEDDGIIIGHTNLPIVNRGDALFHIARIKTKTKGADVVVPDEDEII